MVTTPRADDAPTPEATARQQPPAWLVAAADARGPLRAKEDRDRATLAHLSLVFGAVGPLAVWLLYRDRGPFTAQESKEALNFAGPPTLTALLLFLLSVLPVLGPLLAISGALVWIAMSLYGVMGASHVTKGRPFRYPFNLRILR
ncbi:DUF4870 domain-containing protein [Micrococcus sp.]|uniref:DUF4870 domain-containing protein n=1 Tax=Micrococcus sp. TaxID=1271 RepID=UPI002A91889F|nr:DUF4870 domain-containing protein [Micrococcus sp.]MDY6055442.1 DUF4870 domain-containing protein [Micrococcus sp.]